MASHMAMVAWRSKVSAEIDAERERERAHACVMEEDDVAEVGGQAADDPLCI